MDSFVDNLYPTPLYIANVSSENVFTHIQAEAERAVSRSTFSTRDDWGPTHLLSDVSFSRNVIKDCDMAVLERTIHNHLQNYMDMVGFEIRPYAVTSWLALFKPGQYGHIHNHGDNDVSGCYYIKTKGDGDLFFSDPRPAHETSYAFSGRYMSGARSYKPEVGKLMMFPSYLNHGIKTNTSDEDRISLAFNIKFLDARFVKGN